MRKAWYFVVALVSCLVALPTKIEAQGLCGSKTLCGQMTTCAEAVYYMTACRLKRLDADNDGIPCETICGKTLENMRARVAAQPFHAPLLSKALPLTSSATGATLATTATPSAMQFSDSPKAQFECGSKRTCKDMTSCDEAKFHLTQCGLKRLDGDGDGIPCNGLCLR